jgi:hypothetical protein
MLTTDELEKLANRERERFRRYATGQNEPNFGIILGRLYEEWDNYNSEYFHSVLKPPHITCGQVPPRCWGFYAESTDWGGKAQITLKRQLVWGTSKAVVNPWPALGTMRFILDVLLHETVHQWQHEIAKKNEHSYGGHGGVFAAKCNEIGAVLELPRVVAKRRKHTRDEPSCAYWPHNVRPDGYYCADVDVDRLLNRSKPRHEPDVVQVFRNLLEMLEEGRIEKVKAILREEIDRAGGDLPEDTNCLD